ncbi:hypothetical protein [Urechidicola vernalis]|uniref:DUF4136 domain-containing protein n=1 Tax=Urechidicola vernalis TaxID=3075600 RepID=A0ABU2Y4H6_9FLAO|nr:hypothetical protein [Urechidicola sp. P050]MDT0553081.1 hypothetical protein [Urechidicola sp. P050]
MKKLTTSLLVLTTLLIFSSCNSVKVLGSWKSEKASTINDKNILVIARTANLTARVPFEQEIAKQVRSKGIKATESYKKFPTMNPNAEMTEERMNNVKLILEEQKFNGIILTVLKDKQTSTTVSEYGGGYYTGMPYSAMYPSYYGGFYGYYAHPMSYSTYGIVSSPGYSVTKSTTYVLETVIYNMDLPADEQIIGIVTTKVKDPKNIDKIASKYVEKIVADFNK